MPDKNVDYEIYISGFLNTQENIGLTPELFILIGKNYTVAIDEN